MTDKHMSTAQGHMNDKLRNHGLPAPNEADTAEPMSAEERAREIAKAVLCKGDEQIVLRLAPKQIRQAEQAARAHERRKALEEAAQVASRFGMAALSPSGIVVMKHCAEKIRALSTSSEPGEDT